LMLSETKGKRKPITVKPLLDVAPVASAIDFTTLIEAATTLDELDKLAKAIVKAKLPADELAFLKEMVIQARNILKEKAL